ncbi:MAG: hypothetical protein KAR64_10840 [Thermoplasmatales archaeon]|nr:hypothetical protein [Thermoplasmatales archaeon]
MNTDKPKMDPKAKALVVLFTLLIVGAAIGIVISMASLGFLKVRFGSMEGARVIWRVFADYYMLGTVIICMNLSLLLGLLGSYVSSFRKTKSSFLLGLVLFLGVLFVQSLLSLPIFGILLANFSYQSGLFSLLPNMFETIALIILFHLSME